MFLQLVVGGVSDPEGLRRHLESWTETVAAGATGWLGCTGGVTSGGRALVVTRFADLAAAGAGNRRPESQGWWAATADHLDGPVTLDTADVTAVEVKDASGAGFVQVMHATITDRERLEALEHEMGPAFIELRPDFLAGYRAWFPDGTMAAVDHFRSEAEARAGESRQMPDALRERFAEWFSLVEGAEWHDLVGPWQAAPA